MDPEARLLDEIAADATVAEIEADLDGWRCKAAPDLPFRRANVALPPADCGADPRTLERGLDAVAAWYARRGETLRVQVSTADRHHEALDRALIARSLVLEAPVHVMVARRPLATAPAREHAPEPAPVTVAVHAGIHAQWAHERACLAGDDARQRQRAEAYGRMFAAHGGRALGATATLDGQVVGVGFGVVDRGWLGIFGMGTSATLRRRGIASAVVAALEGRAAAGGATAAYLQVETDNLPAIAAYEALGYQRSHGYHYRTASDHGWGGTHGGGTVAGCAPPE